MRKSGKTPRARRRLPSGYMRGVAYERILPAGYHRFIDYAGTGIHRAYDGSKRRAQRLFARELRDQMPIKNPSRSAEARQLRRENRTIYNRKAWRARARASRIYDQVRDGKAGVYRKDLDFGSPIMSARSKMHSYYEGSKKRWRARYGPWGPNTDKIRKGVAPPYPIKPWGRGE